MTDLTSGIDAALPDYDVHQELGRGAMGVVYLGRHRRLGRDVAIKELAGPLADDPEVRERFLTEARVLAALDHPNIVPIYDYVEIRGRCLLIMEALGGGTVWDRFQRDGLSVSETCSLMLSACEGVEHAHQQGILHRDLKPENLMLSDRGELKVADFGIAKVLDGGRTLATIDGSVLGTPAYMAPEQAEGADVGPTADVYALGTMLFELLSGRLPFDGETPMALLVDRLTSDPPSLARVAPGVPNELCDVVDRSLARSTAARYPTAAALAQDLRRALESASASGRFEKEPPVVTERASPDHPTASATPSAEAGRPTTAPGGATTGPTGAGRTPTVVPGVPPAAGASGASVEPVVRPVVASHVAGFDDELRRDQLVQIEQVVRRPTVRLARPLLVVVVATLLGFVALIAVPGDPGSSVDGLDSASLGGVPLAEGRIELDLTEPLTVSGLPATVAEATLALAVGGVSAFESGVAASKGEASFDLGLVGWLVGGGVDAELTVVDDDGQQVGVATIRLVNARPWWQTASGPFALLMLAFAFAAAESQSRRHHRGRVRPTAAAAAAAGAALAFVSCAVLLGVVTSSPRSPTSIGVAAVCGAVAGWSVAVVRARLARRRRIRWKYGS